VTLLQLVWRRCGPVVERGFPAGTKVDKVDVGVVVSFLEMATAGKARSKVRVSKATPEMQARIERLERELGELFGAPTKAAADALEATVKGIRRVTFGRGQPTERRVLESVVEELDSLARQQLDDKFTVDDSFRLAKLRGELAKGELLTEAGPMLSLQQAADQLGVSKQAVHKRILNRSLFGIKYREELRIPAWQIVDAEVVPGVSLVLKALHTTGWGTMLFLHRPNLQLENRRPKDLVLEGKEDWVAKVASNFGEQGAK
jgi:hypothetical protein